MRNSLRPPSPRQSSNNLVPTSPRASGISSNRKSFLNQGSFKRSVSIFLNEMKQLVEDDQPKNKEYEKKEARIKRENKNFKRNIGQIQVNIDKFKKENEPISLRGLKTKCCGPLESRFNLAWQMVYHQLHKPVVRHQKKINLEFTLHDYTKEKNGTGEKKLKVMQKKQEEFPAMDYTKLLDSKEIKKFVSGMGSVQEQSEIEKNKGKTSITERDYQEMQFLDVNLTGHLNMEEYQGQTYNKYRRVLLESQGGIVPNSVINFPRDPKKAKTPPRKLVSHKLENLRGISRSLPQSPVPIKYRSHKKLPNPTTKSVFSRTERLLRLNDALRAKYGIQKAENIMGIQLAEKNVELEDEGDIKDMLSRKRNHLVEKLKSREELRSNFGGLGNSIYYNKTFSSIMKSKHSRSTEPNILSSRPYNTIDKEYQDVKQQTDHQKVNTRKKELFSSEKIQYKSEQCTKEHNKLLDNKLLEDLGASSSKPFLPINLEAPFSLQFLEKGKEITRNPRPYYTKRESEEERRKYKKRSKSSSSWVPNNITRRFRIGKTRNSEEGEIRMFTTHNKVEREKNLNKREIDCIIRSCADTNKNMTLQRAQTEREEGRLERDFIDVQNKANKLNEYRLAKEDVNLFTKDFNLNKKFFLYTKAGRGHFLDEQFKDMVKMSDKLATVNPKYNHMKPKLYSELVKYYQTYSKYPEKHCD